MAPRVVNEGRFFYCEIKLSLSYIFADWNGSGDSWGIARAEDPALSGAKEAAKAVPPESVRSNGNLPIFLVW